MRRETLVVLLVVGAVLLPMWYVGLQGESPVAEVEIDQSVSEIRPLGGFLDAPNKLSPSQVGVVVWVALFALLGVLTAAHRFMNEAVRPDEPGGAAVSGDPGESTTGDADQSAASDGGSPSPATTAGGRSRGSRPTSAGSSSTRPPRRTSRGSS